MIARSAHLASALAGLLAAATCAPIGCTRAVDPLLEARPKVDGTDGKPLPDGTTDAGIFDTFSDVQPKDASAGDAAQVSTLDGEDVWLAHGWTADIFWDFTGSFNYRSADLQDSWPSGGLTQTLSNEPRSLLALSAPFGEGLLVLAGRAFIALDVTQGTSALHDYHPGSSNTSGPDRPEDVLRVDDWAGAPAILFTSNSLGDGDGLYAIRSDWSLTREDTRNNPFALLVDTQGAFDGRGTWTFYRGFEGGLFRQPDGVQVYSAGRPHHCAVAAASDLVCVTSRHPDTAWEPMQLTIIDATSRAARDVFSAADQLAIVRHSAATGAGIAQVIADRTRLLDVDTSGAVTELARSQTAGWRWTAAVAPPPAHRLGTPPAVFVLDTNQAAGRFRILRLTPPP